MPAGKHKSGFTLRLRGAYDPTLFGGDAIHRPRGVLNAMEPSITLGQGVYGLGEAARFAIISPISARRWFVGRPDSGSGPVLRPDYTRLGRALAISFLDLVDLLVVGRFRHEGISLQTIRKIQRRLQERFRETHPFSHRRLLTDGRRVFLESCAGLDDLHLEEVLSGQTAFPEVLRRYLRDIDYSRSGIAERWRVADGVVLDPARNFGKPTVDDCGIRTSVLAKAYHANARNPDLVADLFGTTPDSVIRAVQFERRPAA